jgi:hypothetical protein
MKNFFARVVNDAHVPIALLVFLVTTVYHFWTGRDLGASYTNSLYAFYAFLTGHAAAYQVWPDKTDGQPPAGGNNGGQ